MTRRSSQSTDRNKYNANEIITGSIDHTIRLWDLRALSSSQGSLGATPLHVFTGHNLAVRRVKFHPFHGNVFASTSYDMSVGVWDTSPPSAGMTRRFNHHTEFVIGLDWHLFRENVLCTTAWDRTVVVWNYLTDPPPTQMPMATPGARRPP